jgi:hypothetical protein
MNDKELEELIKLAQQAPKPSKKESYIKDLVETGEGLNEAQKFIAAFDLKHGKNKVPLATIYDCYSRWATEPLSKLKFLKQFGMIFMPKSAGQYRFSHLNYHPKTIMEKTSKLVAEREKTKKI